jgi:hypothetical protein
MRASAWTCALSVAAEKLAQVQRGMIGLGWKVGTHEAGSKILLSPINRPFVRVSFQQSIRFATPRICENAEIFCQRACASQRESHAVRVNSAR